MTQPKNILLYSHTLIALLALVIGYPKGGALFILAMIPYLMYMVLKCNALFLPALILHCASETSAVTVVYISFILLSFWKYKELFSLKLNIIFWAITGLMPIFIWLVWQRISYVGEYPPSAFSYIGYYLSFFAFFYGTLIAKTFTKQILTVIYAILLIVYILFITEAIGFTRIIVAFTYLYIASFALFLVPRHRNLLFLGITVFAITSLLADSEDSTFTTLFVCLFSFLLTYFYLKNKTSYIHWATGYIPFIIIFVIYAYGIVNYMGVTIKDVPTGIDISNWNNFSNRLSWKLYADRAPFWAGGFNQILEYKHLFPIPDMPNIEALSRTGRISEITFGSHTTFIELIRKYGIIAGGVLGMCLIYIVIISRKVLGLVKLDSYIVPFFSMAIACTIVLSLTGQYEIMPGYALFSLGVLGIAYSSYYSLKTG